MPQKPPDINLLQREEEVRKEVRSLLAKVWTDTIRDEWNGNDFRSFVLDVYHKMRAVVYMGEKPDWSGTQRIEALMAEAWERGAKHGVSRSIADLLGQGGVLWSDDLGLLDGVLGVGHVRMDMLAGLVSIATDQTLREQDETLHLWLGLGWIEKLQEDRDLFEKFVELVTERVRSVLFFDQGPEWFSWAFASWEKGMLWSGREDILVDLMQDAVHSLERGCAKAVVNRGVALLGRSRAHIEGRDVRSVVFELVVKYGEATTGLIEDFAETHYFDPSVLAWVRKKLEENVGTTSRPWVRALFGYLLAEAWWKNDDGISLIEQYVWAVDSILAQSVDWLFDESVGEGEHEARRRGIAWMWARLQTKEWQTLLDFGLVDDDVRTFISMLSPYWTASDRARMMSRAPIDVRRFLLPRLFEKNEHLPEMGR